MIWSDSSQVGSDDWYLLVCDGGQVIELLLFSVFYL